MNTNMSNSPVPTDDDWMEIYHSMRFAQPAGASLLEYHDYTYYVCWGGGPEGGYITNGVKTYRVNRTWETGWVVEPVNERLEFDVIDNVNKLRLVCNY
jgi:hypothetical protein